MSDGGVLFHQQLDEERTIGIFAENVSTVEIWRECERRLSMEGDPEVVALPPASDRPESGGESSTNCELLLATR